MTLIMLIIVFEVAINFSELNSWISWLIIVINICIMSWISPILLRNQVVINVNSIKYNQLNPTALISNHSPINESLLRLLLLQTCWTFRSFSRIRFVCAEQRNSSQFIVQFKRRHFTACNRCNTSIETFIYE